MCVCLQVVRQGLVDPVLHSFHCYHLVQLDLVLQEYHHVPKYYRELNGKRTHFTCMYFVTNTHTRTCIYVIHS